MQQMPDLVCIKRVRVNNVIYKPGQRLRPEHWPHFLSWTDHKGPGDPMTPEQRKLHGERKQMAHFSAPQYAEHMRMKQIHKDMGYDPDKQKRVKAHQQNVEQQVYKTMDPSKAPAPPSGIDFATARPEDYSPADRQFIYQELQKQFDVNIKGSWVTKSVENLLDIGRDCATQGPGTTAHADKRLE